MVIIQSEFYHIMVINQGNKQVDMVVIPGNSAKSECKKIDIECQLWIN